MCQVHIFIIIIFFKSLIQKYCMMTCAYLQSFGYPGKRMYDWFMNEREIEGAWITQH